MKTRMPAPGWCENIPGVLGESWWPGRLIYQAHTYEDGGVVRTALRALCPACGAWVTARADGSVVAHELPRGTNQARDRKRDRARDLYGEMVARDALRPAEVA